MAIKSLNLPRDKYLKHFNVMDVSHWEEVDTEWSGTREKYILAPVDSARKWYLLKFPMYGMNEIYYELFNCYLGFNLGLKYASYYPCTYKGRHGIITRSFLQTKGKNSELWEMKELICHYSNIANLEEKKGRDKEVLREHDIDNIFMILQAEFGDKILPDFFKMVGLDCLLGHGDRHWCNYGIILITDTVSQVMDFRFAPIYDTASGYLLEHTDDALEKLVKTNLFDDEKWYYPKKRGLCKMTVNENPKTGHMDLFEHILTSQSYATYRHHLIFPILKFRIKVAKQILHKLFSGLSDIRKHVILKILENRHRILLKIINKTS